MDEELYLTDLIDVETLQKIQNSFSQLTGIAAVTTDSGGKAVTEGSCFTDFCKKYTQSSPLGCERCEQCNRQGAVITLHQRRPTTYYCHAGLVEFAAPIMTGDHLVGCFIGGQIIHKAPEYDVLCNLAEELGLDPDEYFEAAQKLPIRKESDIDRFSDFLFSIASILSDMAYGKYLAMQANTELQHAASMKSDFLANMSHEIRTPMNAVIGMADMALREELPIQAREYINQIKSSGKALLTIINDILDFSKIESGKMDINVVEYELLSVINDVVNILTTRLKDKDVDLIMDISPNLPLKLLGDNIRIKQILINLANNAVKFTREGQIVIHINFTPVEEDEIMLYVAVEDTGIGIKPEDMDKLFQSFQQLDSKRNRNIEGTGLGLAISKQLLTLMNGSINVESEYEKGSTFSFSLPQKVIDPTPSIQVLNPSENIILSCIQNPYIQAQLERSAGTLGVPIQTLPSPEEVTLINTDASRYLFLEQSMSGFNVEDYALEHPEVNVVLLVNYDDNTKYDITNIIPVKKPLYSMNLALLLNKKLGHYDSGSQNNEEDFDFIAPKAEILIVDDNAVNLTVAQGLLTPLQMRIDTAASGKEAISKISVQHYDIIFMDHMMPELDGVEATHIIRRFHAEYNDVPIIALTANAVDGTKDMFLKEGMNDFIPKPIELQMLVSKVKKWLPVEKIKKVNSPVFSREETTHADIEVADLDTHSALHLLGSEQLFWTVLKDYYHVIDKKAASIEAFLQNEDWANYTIEVHALKSSSRQIGANNLSNKAAALEKAGNARDIDFIRDNTAALLEQYRAYRETLSSYFQEEVSSGDKGAIPHDLLLSCFTRMREAVENLDMDEMEAVIGEMNQYSYAPPYDELFSRLKEAVGEVDGDTCEQIMQEWES
ncbi:MAG: PocR ligand-binding domain-containing protein [Acetatifactor sp.]|nr:PocR ligand-binding domain-containing protein [Acetatifactor sp.]